MAPPVPSFGEKLPGEQYIERPSAYVILEDSRGRIATVHTSQGVFLPGGGLERYESAEEAAVREAGEEAGLEVRIVREIGRADQYLFAEAEGAHFAKRGRYFAGLVVGTCMACEADHVLVWLPSEQALSALTHGSHRWALELSLDPGAKSGHEEDLRGLAEHAWREVDAINAALAAGELDEGGWHGAMAALIEQSYLPATNPFAQAGHDGDAQTWEASRGFIARSGTFLDVGCASGVMMESVARWGTNKGLRIEPYGLEIVPELVDLARRRLPHWADRIVLGNIRTWKPAASPFDMVLIRPEYAPPRRRAELIRHVMAEVVAPGGRLIVLAGTERRTEPGAESLLIDAGLRANERVEVAHPADDRLVRRLFWIDKPG